MKIRIIIAGGRDFSNYPKLKAHVDKFLETITCPVTIVSGGARGADTLGEQYARECGYPVKRFPANWDKYGKSAGPKRNEEMALYAAEEHGVLVAFWDGKSRGTKDMIDRATEYKLEVQVMNY